MLEEATVLTFSSEADRQKALSELPETPPLGTTDIEAWQAEMDEKEQKIMGAEIVDAPSESASEEQPPVRKPEEETPAQEESEDDVIDFGTIKRSELPEVLRKYKEPQQILETAEHARRYANEAEEKLTSANAEIDRLKEQLEKKKGLEDKIKELTEKKESLQSTSDQKPMTTQQRADAQSHLDALNEKIEALKEYNEGEYAPVGETRTILSEAATEISATRNALNLQKEELLETKTKVMQEIAGVKSELQGYISKHEAFIQEESRKKQIADAATAFKNLQDNHSELKTSKPIIGDAGNDVESSIVRFCDKVMGRSFGNDWSVANRIVNAFLRKDEEIVDICNKKGIMPQDFGITEDDIKNYAILMNVDAHMRGYKIDPHSGIKVKIENLFGDPVTFPDPEAAYNYLLDKTGIRERVQEEQIIEAEKNGQKRVEQAFSKRDTSAKTLGNAGSGSPENIGEELSVEQAHQIIGTPAQRGPLTIDERKMELAARAGDRRLFHLYNKALKRLGIPEENPDPRWPIEIVQ